LNRMQAVARKAGGKNMTKSLLQRVKQLERPVNPQRNRAWTVIGDSQEDIERQIAKAKAEGWAPTPRPALAIIIKGWKDRANK
jgi:uncharacterized protein YicC (UPF0701 family)